MTAMNSSSTTQSSRVKAALAAAALAFAGVSAQAGTLIGSGKRGLQARGLGG